MRVASTVALLAILVVGAAGSCTVSDGASTFNLDPVPVANSLPINQVIAANPTLNGVYKWTISLCQAVAPEFGKSCTTRPAFVYEFPNTGGNGCVQSMNTAPAPWTWDHAKGGATRTFNGQGSQAVITVKCDPAAHGLQVDGDAPTAQNGGTWVWNIGLKSSAVCGGAGTPTPQGGPTPSPGDKGNQSPKDEGGLGGGFFFLLALILVAVFYVGGVVVYNYARLGKRGKELAPHPEFWTLLPGLFLDGIVFAKDGVMLGIAKVRGQSGGGGGGGDYASV